MSWAELASMAPGWLIGGSALLGLLVGSFINLLVRRLPLMLQRQWERESRAVLGIDHPTQARFDLWRPASHCPHCGHRLRWWENLPLLSWLALRGRCSSCGAIIGWRYPVVEAGSALLAALLVCRGGGPWQLLLSWSLLALALIDLDCGLLPDALTLPLIWLGLLHASADPKLLVQAVWGAAAGYLSLWTVNAAYRSWRKVDGMGGGDFKLFALLGAWFGWPALPALLLLASVTAAAVGLLQLACGLRQRSQPLAFGPYLAAAAIAALLWPALLGSAGLGA